METAERKKVPGMKLFASIYIGSYEIILKIFQVSKGKNRKEIDCLKAQTGIARDIYDAKTISLETVNRICGVLSDMQRAMETYQVTDYEAYMGSTIQLAKNDLFVIDQIRIRTGMDVTVLSNSEHRFLGYQAVASMDGFSDMVKDSAVIVDVGGASLQITLFVHGKIKTTQHIMLGTVYLNENIKRLSHAANYREQIFQIMYKELDVFCATFLKGVDVKYLILLGDHMSELVERLGLSDDEKRMKTEEYRKFLAVDRHGDLGKAMDQMDLLEDNQELAEAFLLLHQSIAERIPSKYVFAPGVGVSEGIACDYFYRNKILTSTHDFEQDIVSAAWSISKRYESYQPHLKALEKISLMIFDTIKKYHGMGKRERLLMRVVAILHDCGKYISISEAANCSYTIIMSSEILGLSHREREMVATTVAFNRKEPEAYEDVADRFSQQEYVTMVKLLAILKVANALDRSHRQKFKDIKMSVRKGKLDIVVESSDSIVLEKGLFEEKADFFEEIFAIRPQIRERRIFM